MSDRRRDDEHESIREYQGERLQRVLSQRGVASRRAAEKMMLDGRVQVNGRVVTELGTRVRPNRDEIRVDGKVLRPQPPRYVMLNKPTGFITTVSDERDRWTVMDLVDVRERVYPVGRLDRNTQGLLLLTNDGDLAHRVMHPSYRVDKEYLAFTDQRPTETQLQRLRQGIDVDGYKVVPEDARLFRETSEGVAIRIVIHEGLYHEVRRMMEAVGIEITRLRRTRLGPLRLQGIPSGAWRDLTPGELVQLYQAVDLAEEAADHINSRRTIVREPVGGFTHKGAGASGQQRGPGLRGERKGEPTETRQGSRSEGRMGRNDNVRSSQSHRNRRPRRRG
ncbi:MAG TPA: pseudouridine synthase [Thermomicrobiales bacterium]|nr:pseudouridine synthase [Thermomicrobiales bacterium]